MKAFARLAKRLAFSLSLSFLLPVAAQPYERHLHSEAIDEAFNLGRSQGERMGVFLSQYARTFPTPPNGPYIGRIDLLTPYTHVVYAARGDLLNDTVFDAERKYGALDMPVIVRLRVYWPPTTEPPEKDIWNRFPIVVSQRLPLVPTKKSWRPYHQIQRGLGSFDYIDMRLEFSAAQIASDMLTIAASSPDGQRVEAKFDLARLK